MQTETQAETVSYWDALDKWGHARETKRREEWAMQAEQADADAMYTAEVSGGRTLMERAAGPLLFLLAAFIAAGVIVAGGRWAGWIQ